MLVPPRQLELVAKIMPFFLQDHEFANFHQKMNRYVKHNYSLPTRTSHLTDNNFVLRMLYLDALLTVHFLHFHGLSDHLMILLCSTAGFVCMVC